VTSRRPVFGFEIATNKGGLVAVAETEVVRKPFYALVHFQRPGATRRPPVLIVGVLSGHTPLLLHDLLAGLAADHDLYLIEWIDARLVPLSEGDFGMEDNIAAILECLDHLGREAHVIGICQAAMPALAAAALCESTGRPAPLSVTLSGGIIDARINPTRIARFAASHPLSWFEDNLLDTVSPGSPGSGRRVHPACFQKIGLQAYMARHIATGAELLYKVMSDDGLAPLRHPFLKLFLSVMDLPATLYLDTIRLLFQDYALPSGHLVWRGRAVDPAALTRTALMTIEGEHDDISGAGQTRAAHELCRNIPDDRRRHWSQPGIGHFGLFHGLPWRWDILPRLNEFLREAG